MAGTTRFVAVVALGGLILGTAAIAAAQSAPRSFAEPVTRLASFPPGAIQGLVQDELSHPISGAVVTAVGASTLVAVTDKTGRFELRALPPGPYLLRAHLSGFVTPPAQIVQVRSSSR